MTQFTEEEAQRIFARAAERQHTANDAAPGFSMEELQEIGQAAGLSPEHIAAAVADVKAAAISPTLGRTVMGIQTDVRRSRVVPGELTDEIWDGMVSRFRRTFKTQGITGRVGRAREWTGTNSSGGLSNLHVVAAPVEGGTQMTLETSRTEEARQIKWLPVAFAFLSAFFPLIGMAKGKLDEPVLWVFSALILATGVLGFFGSRRGYQRWSETRQGEFDALLDQFELRVRTDSEPASIASPAPPVSEPPLGHALDELADAPDSSSRPHSDRLRT